MASRMQFSCIFHVPYCLFKCLAPWIDPISLTSGSVSLLYRGMFLFQFCQAWSLFMKRHQIWTGYFRLALVFWFQGIAPSLVSSQSSISWAAPLYTDSYTEYAMFLAAVCHSGVVFRFVTDFKLLQDKLVIVWWSACKNRREIHVTNTSNTIIQE